MHNFIFFLKNFYSGDLLEYFQMIHNFKNAYFSYNGPLCKVSWSQCNLHHFTCYSDWLLSRKGTQQQSLCKIFGLKFPTVEEFHRSMDFTVFLLQFSAIVVALAMSSHTATARHSLCRVQYESALSPKQRNWFLCLLNN